MYIVAICEKYGWTWQEYMSQPYFFLELIKEKWQIDVQREALELKKTEKESKRLK